jgi:AraC-like DNA-binding protein
MIQQNSRLMKSKPHSAQKHPDLMFARKRPSKFSGPAVAANHPTIDRCLGFMVQNFHKPIQLKDVVKVSGMSRRGFCKTFNRCLGANPGAWLRNVRIEHAKCLLVEHDLLLKQVAKRCGYRSENTFCVAFQRTVGMPPKKFQRQYWLAISSRQRQARVDESLLLPASDSKTAASLCMNAAPAAASAGLLTIRWRPSCHWRRWTWP